jgi:hypothetical protein
MSSWWGTSATLILMRFTVSLSICIFNRTKVCVAFEGDIKDDFVSQWLKTQRCVRERYGILSRIHDSDTKGHSPSQGMVLWSNLCQNCLFLHKQYYKDSVRNNAALQKRFYCLWVSRRAVHLAIKTL